MEPGSEAQLVARLKRGEPAAFDQIYEGFRARVYSFLVRLSRRRELAEELLQETFLRLANRAPLLADDTRLLPWLFTVARNLYVSHLRMTMTESEHLDRLSLEEPLCPSTPFEHAAATETQATLERALAGLPDGYREVLLLVGVEELEPIEAAKVIGVSPEALRQRLSRARAMLRTALAEQKPERRTAS